VDRLGGVLRRGEGVQDGGKRLVVHLDRLQGVAGEVPVVRYDHRQRLAHVTDLLPR
jgi:hypothetical protein